MWCCWVGLLTNYFLNPTTLFVWWNLFFLSRFHSNNVFLFTTVAREKVDKNYQDFVNNIAVKSRRKNVQQRLIKCFWGFDIFINCHIDLQLIRMIDTKHFLLSFFFSKFCIVARIIWNWIRQAYHLNRVPYI